MLKKTTVSLWIAALMATGCASSKMQYAQPIPPLDSSVAADCSQLPGPPDGDYDELTGWMLDVIGLYGDCAARHRATVKAWEAL